MVYNAENFVNISEKDQQLYVLVAQIIEKLFNYLKSGPESAKKQKFICFECHSICRAISIYIPELTVVTGSYAGLKHSSTDGITVRVKQHWNDHSWLLTPDKAIIDPHPVGIITIAPLLVVGKGKNAPCGNGLYVPNWNVIQKVTNRQLLRKSHFLSEHIKRLMCS